MNGGFAQSIVDLRNKGYQITCGTEPHEAQTRSSCRRLMRLGGLEIH